MERAEAPARRHIADTTTAGKLRSFAHWQEPQIPATLLFHGKAGKETAFRNALTAGRTK